MKKEGTDKPKDNAKYIGLTLFMLFFVFLGFHWDTIYWLVIILAFLTAYFITALISILKERRPARLFWFRLLSLMFNATFLIAVSLGLFFSSPSNYINLFSDTNLVLGSINAAIVLMTLIFFFKKVFVHMPLEYSLLKGDEPEKTGNTDSRVKAEKISFMVLTPILYPLLLLTNFYEKLNISLPGVMLMIVIILPLLLFLFSIYLDIRSSFNRRYAFALRFFMHAADFFVLYLISAPVVRYLVPNLAVNQSILIPLLVIIPFLYLMHEIREYLLAIYIKSKHIEKIM